MKHENGLAHKNRNKVIINQPTLVQFYDQKVSSQKSVQTAEIRIASFIVEHNLSVRVADHLTQLIKSVSLDSEITPQISCGRTKCSSIIKNVTGENLKIKIIDQLKTNKFSLMIDEFTDRH